MSETHLEIPLKKMVTRGRANTFRALSTKLCFFCTGFLFGLLLAVLLLAAFQTEEQKMRISSSRSIKGFVTTTEALEVLTSGQPVATTTSMTTVTTNSSVETTVPTTTTTTEATVGTTETTVGTTETTVGTPLVSDMTTNDIKSEFIPELRSEDIIPKVSQQLETKNSTIKSLLDEMSTKPVLNLTTTTTETTTQVITTEESNNVSEVATHVMTVFSETTFQTTTPFSPKENNETTETTTTETSNTTIIVTRDVTRALTASPLNETSLNTTEEVTSLPLNTTNETFCLSSQFLCPKKSICLDRDLLCDGKVDCPLDGFDESDCLDSCGANFKCGNFCISRQNYCDGLWDCPQGQDELGCHVQECPNGEFLCKDLKRCIKGKEACDHVSHCDDHSDEIGCVNKEKCESLQRFFCSNGLCIDRSLRCDSIDDCDDSSDEQNCETKDSCFEKNGFLCDNRECVSMDKRCDGRDDCGDHSDEFLCVTRDPQNIVLFFSQNSWRPLCLPLNFTSHDADLICQLMGHWRASSWQRRRIQPLGGFWITNERLLTENCFSNESLVLNCFQDFCGNSSLNSDSSLIPNPIVIKDQNQSQCLSHVIAPNWLILGAKCLKRLSQNVSSLEIHSSEDKLLPIFVEQLLPHFRHSHFRSLKVPDFDVALVRTLQTLPPPEVCLPPHVIDPAITCFAAEDTPFEVMESAQCNSSSHFAGKVTSRHLCAVAANQKSCLSIGQPLLCLSSQSLWYISGFLSFCYNNSHVSHPNLFSNVFSVKQWILKAIGKQLVLFEDKYYSEEEESKQMTTISSNEEEKRTTEETINSTQMITSITEESTANQSSLMTSLKANN